jgi:hypothetical protein
MHFLAQSLEESKWLEPNQYPVDKCIINGKPYEQHLVREHLKEFYYEHIPVEEIWGACMNSGTKYVRCGTIENYIEQHSKGIMHWKGDTVKHCLCNFMDDIIIDGFWENRGGVVIDYIEYFYNFALGNRWNTTILSTVLMAL